MYVVHVRVPVDFFRNGEIYTFIFTFNLILAAFGVSSASTPQGMCDMLCGYNIDSLKSGNVLT